MKIIKIIKNWTTPDIFRQTPSDSGEWNNCTFTEDDRSNYDFVIVLNYVNEDITVECPKENIFVVMQEPYIKGTFDWMVDGHKQFSKVFSHHIFNNKAKYIASNPTSILPQGH